MPELPEVQTTVTGLNEHIVGLVIRDVWSNYNSSYFKGSEIIKDSTYFIKFKKAVTGSKIISVKRRAKNVLINLDSRNTILVHMKMTGHLLYGLYKFNPRIKSDPWEPISPSGLKDPFNRRVRFVLSMSNGKFIALSDMRRFAKVTLIKSSELQSSIHTKDLGPEPLDNKFTFKIFSEKITAKNNWKIKQTLLDQTVIAGIGNIYADESLWRANIHPKTLVRSLSTSSKRKLYMAIRQTLAHGIELGGDSMSDYRNIHGEKGGFQEKHCVYRRKGLKCLKKGCGGIIARIVVAGRGTHFCPKHQK